MSDKKETDNPDIKVRSLAIQTAVWDALDDDARKCRRSSVKQLEAILVAYYKLSNIELDYDQLEEARRIVGPQSTGGKVEIIGLEHEAKERGQSASKTESRQPKKKAPDPMQGVGFRIIGMGHGNVLDPPNKKKVVPAVEEKTGKKKGPRNEG